MKAADLQHSLLQAWQTAIEAGKFANEFVAPFDDPQQRWQAGDRIVFGLRMGADVEFYAINREPVGRTGPLSDPLSGQPISLQFEERVLASSGIHCSFCEHRLFKPGASRPSPGRQPAISPDEQHCRFFCREADHPLSLRSRAPLATISLRNFQWNAYHNAVPLEPRGHFLFVPLRAHGASERLPHLPQRLSSSLLADLLELSSRLPDLVLLFNSLGAGASVNHIHAQAVCRASPLAIERAATRRYRGYWIVEDYPAKAVCFTREDDAEIDRVVSMLQEESRPYNIVICHGRIFVIPRNADHEIVAELPGDAMAGIDFVGRLSVLYRDTFDRLDEECVARAFSKTIASVTELVERLA